MEIQPKNRPTEITSLSTNVPTRTMGATANRIRITVPGIPVLTTTGIIPGGDMAAIILPGIMAVIMVAVTTVAVTTVAATMVVATTTAVTITTLAESDLRADGGEFLTTDAVPDPGAGRGPDWKEIRKEINLANEYLVDEVGKIGAVGEAGEMRDTEEVGNPGVKDHRGCSEIPALRPKGVRSDEAQDEVQDEVQDEAQDEAQDGVQDGVQDEAHDEK